MEKNNTETDTEVETNNRKELETEKSKKINKIAPIIVFSSDNTYAEECLNIAGQPLGESLIADAPLKGGEEKKGKTDRKSSNGSTGSIVLPLLPENVGTAIDDDTKRNLELSRFLVEHEKDQFQEDIRRKSREHKKTQGTHAIYERSSSFQWDSSSHDTQEPDPVLHTAHKLIIQRQTTSTADAIKGMTRKQLDEAMTPPESRKVSNSSLKETEEVSAEEETDQYQEMQEDDLEEAESTTRKNKKGQRRFSLRRKKGSK